MENSLAVPGRSQQLHVSRLSGPMARTARPVIAVFVEGLVFFLKLVYKMYFMFKVLKRQEKRECLGVTGGGGQLSVPPDLTQPALQQTVLCDMV